MFISSATHVFSVIVYLIFEADMMRLGLCKPLYMVPFFIVVELIGL